MVAPLRVRKKRFIPARNPLYRAAQAARGPDQHGFFRVMLALVAKTTAHVRRYQTKRALCKAELRADVIPDVVWRLGGAIQGISRGDDAAGFDRTAAHPVVHELQLDD